jgi:DNA replication protein DnaC
MGELQRANSVKPFNLPQGIFERMGGRQTAEEVARSCLFCGTDVPPVHYTNGWVPGKCVCEQKRYEVAQAEKARAEQQARERTKLQVSCGKCYTWLGEDLTPLASKTFENYRRDFFPVAYDRLRNFTEHRDDHGKVTVPHRNFLIFGGFGTGKTHLMSAAINAFCEQLIPCRFLTGQGLFDAISSCFSNRQDHIHYLNEAANAPILAIIICQLICRL